MLHKVNWVLLYLQDGALQNNDSNLGGGGLGRGSLNTKVLWNISVKTFTRVSKVDNLK